MDNNKPQVLDPSRIGELIPDIISPINKETVLEVGFEKSEKDQWVGWYDYVLREINPEYGYYLYCTLHIPRVETWGGQKMMYKILLHRHYNDKESNIDYWLNEYEAEQVYHGMIPNIEKLKELLQLLYIMK